MLIFGKALYKAGQFRATRRSTPNGEGAMQKAVRKAEAANIEAIANAAASGKPAPASGVPKARAAVVVAEDHVAAPGRLMGDGGPSFARACPLLARSRLRQLFNNLISAGKERRRHSEAECFRRLEVDHQLEFGRALHW